SWTVALAGAWCCKASHTRCCGKTSFGSDRRKIGGSPLVSLSSCLPPYFPGAVYVPLDANGGLTPVSTQVMHAFVPAVTMWFAPHPIFPSMFCMLFGTGLMITPLPILLLAATLFIAGTEVRVRLEETLLAWRFGDAFRDYQCAVPAYIPLLKHSSPKDARASP